MKKVLSAAALAAVAVASFAAPASAIRPCDDGDIQCYRTCYLPHFDKENGIYWVYC